MAAVNAQATVLLTVGHSTASQEAFTALLRGAGIETLADVRSCPASRRHPHFAREAMSAWLAEAGIAYQWIPDLGGRRTPSPMSANTALRHRSFRGYGDWMAGPQFAAALEAALALAGTRRTAVMCSEALWWKCHRRLLADAAALVHGARVLHLGHDGRLTAHAPTEGARTDGPRVVYDAAGQGVLV